MKRNSVIALVVICILIIVIVALCLIFALPKHKESSNAHAPYSVTPDTSAQSNNPSISVTGLADAQKTCFADFNCKSFIYNETGKTMKIVDLKSNKFSKPGTHLFVLQSGVQAV